MALVMDSLALCLLVLISVAIADKASLDWGFDSDAQLEYVSFMVVCSWAEPYKPHSIVEWLVTA